MLILYFWPSCCPNFVPFWMFESCYGPPIPYKVRLGIFVCLHSQFFSPVMDLQFSKWKIVLKIVHFVLLTFFLPNYWALFVCLKASLTHLCLSQYSFGIVLFAQPFFQPFMDLQCFKWKIGPWKLQKWSKFGQWSKIQNRQFWGQFSIWNTVNPDMDWTNDFANKTIPGMYFERHR